MFKVKESRMSIFVGTPGDYGGGGGYGGGGRGDGGGGGSRVGGSWRQVLATARAMGVTADPVLRQELAKAYTHFRVEGFVNRRASDMRRAGQPAGPDCIWLAGHDHLFALHAGMGRHL